MDRIGYWFLKYVMGKRVVVVVEDDGESVLRVVKLTEGKKAFVQLTKDRVGFLDNPLQKEGEFRKNLSAPGLVKWFDM
jgi:hypothetical protein